MSENKETQNGKILKVMKSENTIENIDGSVYQARILDPKESGRFDKSLPMEWWTPTKWLFRTIGYSMGRGGNGPPADSGAGWVQSPWVNFYTVVYGVLPIADLPKYRLVYRSRPEVKAAIDTPVEMAIKSWFIIKHKVPEIATYLNDLMKTIGAKEAVEAGFYDLQTYGNMYMEVLWSDKVKEDALTDEINPSMQEELVRSYGTKMNDYFAQVKTNDGLKTVVKAKRIHRIKHDNVKPSVVGLKVLDPLYMRVRRDSWGNIYGYIQWLSMPPAIIDNDCLIHVKWSPKSWSYECFPSGTLVRTNPGFKSIETITDGNKVLMHTGKYGIVEQTKNFRYTGDMYKINTWHSNIPITCTPTHPFYAKTYEKLIDNRGRNLLDATFVKAKDLNKKDYLMIPIDRTIEERKEIVLEGLHKGYTKRITIDKDFMRLCGYYISEGFLCGNSQGFVLAFDNDEIGFANDVAEIVRKYGLTANIKRRNNAILVIIKSPIFARFFKEEFGHNSHKKRLPMWCMNTSLENQKELIEGMIRGDGWVQSNRYSIATVSQELAHQLFTLFLRQNVIPSIALRNQKGGILKDGRKINSGDIYTVTVHNRKDISKGNGSAKGRIENDYCLLPIRNIEKVAFDGLIYNLDIDNDETFTVGIGYAVHNSAYGCSDLMPILKHVDLLNQFENDAAVWMHYRAIPPLIVKGGGDPKTPYTSDQMSDLIKKFGKRTPATTIFVKSDASVEEIKGAAANLNVKWWYEYLTSRILMALKIPPMMVGMGMAGSMRGVSEIVFQAYLSRVGKLQDSFSEAFTQQVLVPLVKERFGDKVIADYGLPEIHWNPLVEEDRNQRQKRILQMVIAGVLSPNEGRLECGYDKHPDPEMDKIRYVDPIKLAVVQMEAKMSMMGNSGEGSGANSKPNEKTKDSKGMHPKPDQAGLGGIKKEPSPNKMPLELNREDMEQNQSINRDMIRLFPETRDPNISEKFMSSLDKVLSNINQSDLTNYMRGLVDEALLELGAGDTKISSIKAKVMDRAKGILAVYYERVEDVDSNVKEFESIIDGIIKEYTMNN